MDYQDEKIDWIARPLNHHTSFRYLDIIHRSEILSSKESREEIKQSARALASTRKVPVLKISQLAGMIISRAYCLDPAARMRTRDRLRPDEKGMQKCGWKRFVSLRTNTKAELIF
jgi:hypothetical protein